MSLFSPPKAPDPSQSIALGAVTARQQQNLNNASADRQQAMNMVSQSNPYGSLTYQQTGTGPNGAPIYSATMTLSPEQQQLYNALVGNQSTSGQQAQALLSGANYGSVSPADAIGDMSSGYMGQMMDKYQASVSPFQQMSRDRLDTQLRNQGLAPGNPAYDNAMRGLDTSQNLANSQAAANYANQAFQQANTLYNAPWTIAQQMAKFGAPGDVKSNIVQTPTTNVESANQIAATANAQQALQNQYNAQYQQYGDMMNGLFKIGTAALLI